jgi:hypothetical protein
MARVERSDRLPQCSRCRGDLITSVVLPTDDEHGRPIHLELCAACDADKPAAPELIRFFADGGGGRDTSRSDEGARLLWAWTREEMAAYGWFWEQTPPGHN